MTQNVKDKYKPTKKMITGIGTWVFIRHC